MLISRVLRYVTLGFTTNSMYFGDVTSKGVSLLILEFYRFPSSNLKPSWLLMHAVAQLVEAMRYKPEGRGFDSRWCHWSFSLT